MASRSVKWSKYNTSLQLSGTSLILWNKDLLSKLHRKIKIYCLRWLPACNVRYLVQNTLQYAGNSSKLVSKLRPLSEIYFAWSTAAVSFAISWTAISVWLKSRGHWLTVFSSDTKCVVITSITQNSEKQLQPPAYKEMEFADSHLNLEWLPICVCVCVCCIRPFIIIILY